MVEGRNGPILSFKLLKPYYFWKVLKYKELEGTSQNGKFKELGGTEGVSNKVILYLLWNY